MQLLTQRDIIDIVTLFCSLCFFCVVKKINDEYLYHTHLLNVFSFLINAISCTHSTLLYQIMMQNRKDTCWLILTRHLENKRLIFVRHLMKWIRWPQKKWFYQWIQLILRVRMRDIISSCWNQVMYRNQENLFTFTWDVENRTSIVCKLACTVSSLPT